MSIVVTVAETSDIVVTTSSTIGGASTMAFTPHGNITSTNIQDALNEIIDNSFNQATVPTGPSVQEGDTWYDTANSKLMVWKNGDWEELLLTSELSDNISSQDLVMDGGTF